MDYPPPVEVSDWELRKLFNDAGLVERADRGEIIEDTMPGDHLSRDRARLQEKPFCTWSHTIVYRDPDYKKLATCHAYIYRDRIIGRPDPKQMLVNGVLYRAYVSAPASPPGAPLAASPRRVARRGKRR